MPEGSRPSQVRPAKALKNWHTREACEAEVVEGMEDAADHPGMYSHRRQGGWNLRMSLEVTGANHEKR